MNNLFSLSSIAGTRTSLVRRFAIAGLCALAAALCSFRMQWLFSRQRKQHRFKRHQKGAGKRKLLPYV